MKTNTEQAARSISYVDDVWLDAIKHRLLDTTDFTNASIALGEVRAYGALLQAGLKVRPAPAVAREQVVPEFEVDAGDGRALSKSTAASWTEHGRRQSRRITRRCAKQLGQPKQRIQESIFSQPARWMSLRLVPRTRTRLEIRCSLMRSAVSARSRRTNTKAMQASRLSCGSICRTLPCGACQFRKNRLAPLWTARDGKVGSGALWFALYGRKGDPMRLARAVGPFRRFNLAHPKLLIPGEGVFGLSFI